MVILIGIVLLVFLLALSWIDIKTYRLPNPLTFSLIALGMLQGWMIGDWQASLIGTVVGYTAFVAIELTFKKLRGVDGLGRGDAKLLAAGGAWCGWMGLPFIILIASGSALVAMLFPSFNRRLVDKKIPFGSFLAFGIALVWMAGVSVTS